MISEHCIEINAIPTWNQILGLGRRRCATDLIRLIETLDIWMSRVRQRRDLLALDDRMLSDVGVNRAAAEAEAEKPFWRP